MKRIIFIALLVVAGYYFFKKSDVQEKLSSMLEPQITISDLKNHPSVFADSLVELKNLRVIETQSMMNYSRSKVSDVTGQEMVLLSSRPFRSNEIVSEIKGHFIVMYQYKNKSYEIFISDDLKPFNDLMKVIKQSLLF